MLTFTLSSNIMIAIDILPQKYDLLYSFLLKLSDLTQNCL